MERVLVACEARACRGVFFPSRGSALSPPRGGGARAPPPPPPIEWRGPTHRARKPSQSSSGGEDLVPAEGPVWDAMPRNVLTVARSLQHSKSIGALCAFAESASSDLRAHTRIYTQTTRERHARTHTHTHTHAGAHTWCVLQPPADTRVSLSHSMYSIRAFLRLARCRADEYVNFIPRAQVYTLLLLTIPLYSAPNVLHRF